MSLTDKGIGSMLHGVEKIVWIPFRQFFPWFLGVVLWVSILVFPSNEMSAFIFDNPHLPSSFKLWLVPLGLLALCFIASFGLMAFIAQIRYAVYLANKKK